MRNKVLQILRDEARLSDAEIAKRLGLGEADVKKEIEALEANQTVLGYRAVVNPEKLPEETTLGIIEVKITPQRDVGYDDISRQIYKFPEVKTCYLISGAYDLLVFIEGKDLRQVALFVSQKLATIPNVTSTTTHFILRKYKDAGLMIQEVETTERLPVAP